MAGARPLLEVHSFAAERLIGLVVGPDEVHVTVVTDRRDGLDNQVALWGEFGQKFDHVGQASSSARLARPGMGEPIVGPPPELRCPIAATGWVKGWIASDKHRPGWPSIDDQVRETHPECAAFGGAVGCSPDQSRSNPKVVYAVWLHCTIVPEQPSTHRRGLMEHPERSALAAGVNVRTCHGSIANLLMLQVRPNTDGIVSCSVGEGDASDAP